MLDQKNRNQKVILVGFGGGFTYGSALINLWGIYEKYNWIITY
jgi:3-oxoacyl-[acyl-carrier-protein] synthase-3